MKIKPIIVAILFLIISHQKMISQNTAKPTIYSPPPSDAPTGYTYDFNKAQSIILDRITNPNAANADAQLILNARDFPVLRKETTIGADSKEKLKTWMENNPNIIIATFKNRNDVVTPF